MSKRLLVASLLPVAAMAAPQTEQPMVVTATRFAQPVASVLAPVNIVTRDEIDRLQVRTVTEVVRTLPGVEISSTGGRGQNATALVRGATASQTLILVDGVRIVITSYSIHYTKLYERSVADRPRSCPSL